MPWLQEHGTISASSYLNAVQIDIASYLQRVGTRFSSSFRVCCDGEDEGIDTFHNAGQFYRRGYIRRKADAASVHAER